MMSQHRIVELAAIISENTNVVNEYFVSHKLPTPTLDHTAPGQLPIPADAPEIEQARRTVIEATDELQALMRGPRELLFVPVRPRNRTRLRNPLSNVDATSGPSTSVFTLSSVSTWRSPSLWASR